jgi:hypothetical protein
MDFIERRFAYAEHQRTLLLKANVGGALNELRCDAISDSGQRADTAGDHDHSVGRVRAAGYVRADVGVGLLLNFSGVTANDLVDELIAACDVEFLGHDPKAAIGGNEVNCRNSLVGFDDPQQLLEEYRAAGASSGDGQVARGILVLMSLLWQALAPASVTV